MRFLEIRNTTVPIKNQLQSIGTCKHNLHSYKYLDDRIRQEHVESEADKVYNGLVSRTSLWK